MKYLLKTQNRFYCPKIDTALYTIEKNNPALKGALPDNYYSRLHIDTVKLASLLDEINRINTDDKENDIIGRVYEYFLKLAKMNLAIRGISANLGEMAANTFTNDQHKDLKADSDDGTELKIRQQLIENHLVEAIIILPRNLFYTTDISVTLWVLNKNKKARVVEQNGKLKRYRNREDEILFMDLRQMGSPYEKKYIELTEEDRAKVTSVYHNWQQEGYEETYENVPEFCYSASFDEVKEKGFTLVPSRYIEFVNRDENIDFDTKMKSLQGELKELLVQEEKSKADLLAVFKELGYEIKL